MGVKIYSSFDELPDSYHGFFREQESESFFFSRAWFESLATTLGSEATLRLYALEKEKPRAVLICRTPAGQEGSVLQRRAKGRRTLAGLTNFQSVKFAPLVSRSEPSRGQILKELVGAICRSSPPWSAVELNCIHRDSYLFEETVASLRDGGFEVRPYFHAGVWYEHTEGVSFNQYLGEHRRLRKKLRRSRRNLERQFRTRIELVVTESELDNVMETYWHVHEASWKGPEPYPWFIERLLRMFATLGVLRLGILYVDDEPVATELWIVSRGRATAFKGAFDERLRSYSIGTLLCGYLMEYAIEVDRVREVDFGMGDEKYKAEWLSERREHWGILAFDPRTVWGRLALTRHTAGQAVFDLLNGVRESFR